jgi:peptidoglycan/LPS O-acetylase OafA/YrhL
MVSKQETAVRAPVGRIPELDMLRFFAALSVVAYHYTYRPVVNTVTNFNAFWPLPVATRFGYHGVTLFFMISGFVILWSAQARSAGEFAISRVARLYPSFWICVCITTIVVTAAGGLESIAPRTIALNLTMVPGWLGAPYVDGVYWTLLVELKFYLMIFLVLATGMMAYVEPLLGIWLVAAALSTFGVAPRWITSLSLHPYGPYFISGCLFYLLRARGASVFRVGALPIACALGAIHAVRGQAEFMHEITPQTSFVIAVFVILFHAIFAAIVVIPGILPASQWWYKLGCLTYPLYLLHNRIGKLIFASFSTSHSAWASLVVELALILTLSGIIAAVVERRACGVFHKALLETAIRLRAVRPSRA